MVYVWSVVCFAGLNMALAAVLMVAARVLVNYGTCKLDINVGEQQLEVEGGQTLLSALYANEVFIPSACGGKGSCGHCKITVNAGGGPVLPTETPYLTRKEIKADVRLALPGQNPRGHLRPDSGGPPQCPDVRVNRGKRRCPDSRYQRDSHAARRTGGNHPASRAICSGPGAVARGAGLPRLFHQFGRPRVERGRACRSSGPRRYWLDVSAQCRAGGQGEFHRALRRVSSQRGSVRGNRLRRWRGAAWPL